MLKILKKQLSGNFQSVSTKWSLSVMQVSTSSLESLCRIFFLAQGNVKDLLWVSSTAPQGAMAFVKVLKNAAYFKRFQVARRRRREGKTDYHARRKMVRQDKNKFNNRKYRLVVRFTNRRCICQCVYATLRGDIVVAAASSHELAQFGIPAGHKNYAAAYATGLLLARRVLKKFGLDEKFKGKEEIDGEEYHVEDEETEQRPFKCILDVGIRRTCVGHRMWGALKGAVDGGLHVPHKPKNFPGYKAAEEKGGESEYDAEAHKEKIFGNHVTWLFEDS